MAAAPQIKIEKGIPQPVRGRGGRKYPWSGMDVGDSFFVPDVTSAKLSGAASSYTNHRRRTGKSVPKFSVRKVDGGVRVWRTA